MLSFEEHLGLAVMDRCWRQEGDTAVPVLVIVPGDEGAAPREGVLEAVEALGVGRVVLQRPELILAEGVVVADAGLALGVAGAVVSTGCPNDLCSKGSCANGQYATGCKIGFVTHVYCTSTPSQGEGFCATDGGAYAGTELCGGATSATSGPYYPDWDPDAAITLVSGVYEVDSDMVDQIRDDFNTVTLMDSSRTVERSAA